MVGEDAEGVRESGSEEVCQLGGQMGGIGEIERMEFQLVRCWLRG